MTAAGGKSISGGVSGESGAKRDGGNQTASAAA